jgi:hypothetical protein
MLHGSTRPHTWHSATGHDGRAAGSAWMTGRLRPPRGRRGGLGLGRWGLSGEKGLPAEAERAADQRPVSADRPVASDLEVGPAELAFDLLVALLDPVAQPVPAHDVGQVDLDTLATELLAVIDKTMQPTTVSFGFGHRMKSPKLRRHVGTTNQRRVPGPKLPMRCGGWCSPVLYQVVKLGERRSIGPSCARSSRGCRGLSVSNLVSIGGSGPVRSRTPLALRSSATRDDRPAGHGKADSFPTPCNGRGVVRSSSLARP